MPTSRLDLSVWKPDFVPISFYKMFGYPTGLGALLARRSTLEKLQRPWFSGGTVVAANVQAEMVVPESGHALFEDGTVNYLGIPAIAIGLRHLEHIGIDTVARRVDALGAWLLEALQGVRHSNGEPATRVYGPTTWDRRGGTIAFNFLHPDGAVRVSLGLATNFADVYRFVSFATEFLDVTEVPADLPPRVAC